ncbi:MAG TPA: shikimate dehydrogenase [Opitutaceae bacterium]
MAPSSHSEVSERVFTLADLANWPVEGTWLAVLGQPIKHSISPAMHNAALAVMAREEARFATWRYVRFEIAPDDLPIALRQFHAKRFFGLNLTVPHKVLACAHVQRVDPRAQPIGAVNTLRWRDDGWEGFNTDGYGLAQGLREDLNAQLTGADIILLGAGGAARGAAVECLQAGCASLTIANRTEENLRVLIEAMKPLASRTKLRGFDPQSPPADLPKGAWVVNATSAGLKSTEVAPINLEHLPRPAGVYDMIYNPPLTPLLRQAQTLGLPSANGLSMLVYQGARALEIWSDRSVPVDAMATAAKIATAR